MHRDDDTSDSVLEIEWDGDQTRWVRLARDWQQRAEPATVVSALTDRVNERCPADPASWPERVSLATIEIEELPTFNELIEAALAEERAHPPVHETTSGRRWSALWSAGRLLNLDVDQDWMTSTSTQELCEALTDAVQRPPADATPRPARDRFVKYMGGI